MFNTDNYWITIAEVRGFSSTADTVLTKHEREALTDYLAIHPLAGDVIEETGGVRMIRWPAQSQGRNGNVRIIYFFRDLNMPVYLLAIYEKGERMSLLKSEKREIRNLVEELVETYGVQWAAFATSSGAA